jgi:hypothetical protein
MQIPDVNVLVYAHRRDAPDHGRYRHWAALAAGGRGTRGGGRHACSTLSPLVAG